MLQKEHLKITERLRKVGEVGMIDIKFVIKGLEDANDVIRKSELTGSKKIRLIDACCNAVTLLKEQPEIVRCKDCKHYNTYECENDNVLRRIKDCGCYPPFWVDPEWFCADGERR